MTAGGNKFNYFPENRTTLMLLFCHMQKKFRVQRGGDGPSGPMVNTPLQSTNVTSDRRTDGRTDRRTTCDRKTALCTKVHCAVKIHKPRQICIRLIREFKLCVLAKSSDVAGKLFQIFTTRLRRKFFRTSTRQ